MSRLSRSKKSSKPPITAGRLTLKPPDRAPPLRRIGGLRAPGSAHTLRGRHPDNEGPNAPKSYPLRAAIYTRVSTDEQAEEGYSLAEQERRCLAHIEAQGWTPTATFADEGVSDPLQWRSARRAATSLAVWTTSM